MPSPNPYPPPGPSHVESRAASGPSGKEALMARKKLTQGVADVYVPVRPGSIGGRDGVRRVEFELRRFADGSAGLPVFTESALLIEQLGEYQAWEKIPVLELLIQISAAKIPVTVNPVLQAGAERWTAAGIEQWRRSGE